MMQKTSRTSTRARKLTDQQRTRRNQRQRERYAKQRDRLELLEAIAAQVRARETLTQMQAAQSAVRVLAETLGDRRDEFVSLLLEGRGQMEDALAQEFLGPPASDGDDTPF